MLAVDGHGAALMGLEGIVDADDDVTGALDHYRPVVTDLDAGGRKVVALMDDRCTTVLATVNDGGDQCGVTLGDMVRQALTHETEAH